MTSTGSGIYIPDGTSGEINFLGYTTDLTSQGMVGSIDEFRVWSGALSDNDIWNNFIEGPTGIFNFGFSF